jgi:glycosyltransferase involved in cell wall biosynthesis
MAGIPWVFTKKNMSWGGSSQNSWKLRSTLANGIVIQNKDMRERFYKNSNKVVQIPRGVDTSSFQPARPKPHIREKMGTPANRRVILSVANMLPVKGLELLTEAFYKLPHHHHQWTLWLVGEYNNPYGKQILDWVHRHDMENIIRFSGKITDVKAYLDHGELFVLPTKDEGRIEGTPVAMLEAMANGKVVVGSEVAGIKDQLEGCPEHLFEPGNVESLKNKLDEFMQNSPETNRNIGQQFINRVKDRLSLEQEIQRHESFYHRIIKTSAKTPAFSINSGI